jgi:hypothetical protein
VCVNSTCELNYTVGASGQGFVDACLTGTPVAGSPFLISTDDGSAGATMPFPFLYYSQSQTSFWMSSNGSLGFGAPPGNSAEYLFACPMPTSSDPPFALAVFGDDQITSVSGICASVVGSAPNRKLVVTWKNSTLFASPTATLLYSAIMSETTNTIDVVYGTMTDTNAATLLRAQGQMAAIGMQDLAPTLATVFACHTPSAPAAGAVTPSGTSIRFTP